MDDFKQIVERRAKSTNAQIKKLDDRSLKEYGVALYMSEMPIDEIMERTSMTRTRLYNALRRAGITPNRQVPQVMRTNAELDRTFELAYKDAQQEIGALKYQLQMKDIEIAALKGQITTGA
jgi:hypothetical protein